MRSRTILRPARAAPVAFGLTVLLVLAAAAAPSAAQVPGGARVDAPGADRITRRLQHVSPASGPPGTMVTVSSALMPHLTPARVAMGATRIGFEALAELLTSATGDFEVQVTVPEWTRWDRNHRFILFDFYFNPIAASDAFFVTDAEGRLRREGQVIREGGCLAVRDIDGEVFAVAPDAEGQQGLRLEEGARVVVTGTLVAAPPECGERPALRLVEIRSVPIGPDSR